MLTGSPPLPRSPSESDPSDQESRSGHSIVREESSGPAGGAAGPETAMVAVDPSQPEDALSPAKDPPILFHQPTPATVMPPPSPILRPAALTLSGAQQSLEALAEKQQQLTVLEFRADGTYLWRQMTRSQVLQEANSLSEALKGRDIRQHVLSKLCKPNMWIRRHSALINIYELKAIILHRKCFLFVPDGADSLLSHVMNRLASGVNDVASAPFEFRALESLLLTICSTERAHAEQLQPQVECMVRDGLSLVSTSLKRMQLLKQQLTECHNRTEATRSALADVLDDDSDLEAMGILNKEELEELLEAYMLEISSIAEDVRTWQENIATVEAAVMVGQDLARNQLLKANLVITVMTLSLGIGNMLAAVFGMNLKSGLENSDGVFATVAAVIGVGSLVLPLITLLVVFNQFGT